MGEYYQQGYHNTTADYAGRVAGYAGTSLKESRQNKAQNTAQNKSADSAQDNRPKLPFADFIDGLADAAWVGVKKANETIHNVQSAIMNGAVGLGSAAIGGVKDLVNSEFAQKSKNLVSNVVNGQGIHWENNLERGERLTSNIFIGMDNLYANANESGDQSNTYYKKPGALGYSSLFMDSDYRNSLQEGRENSVEAISDPEYLGQNSQSKLFSGFKNFFSDVSEGKNKLDVHNDLKLAIKVNEMLKADISKIEERKKNGETLTEDEIKYLKARGNINENLKSLNGRKEKVETIIDYLNTNPLPEITAKDTYSKLCNVISYWEYGKVTGKDDRNFYQFYEDELMKGNIGNVDKNGKVTNLYDGEGTGEWDQTYKLKREDNGHKETFIDDNGNEKTKYVYDSTVRKDDEVKKLNDSGKNTAIFWVNYGGDHAGEQKGHHFVLAKKGSDGTWYNYDHSNTKRRGEVDWSQVWQIRY